MGHRSGVVNDGFFSGLDSGKLEIKFQFELFLGKEMVLNDGGRYKGICE